MTRRPPRSRADVLRELQSHVDERTEELVAGGADPVEARKQALDEFGDPEAAARAMTDGPGAHQGQGWTGWLETVLRDLRLSLRSLLRAPAYTVPAVLALAAGVGAVTAIFSVVDGVLLEPLEYANADEIVTVWSTGPDGGAATSPSWPDYRDWQAEARHLTDVAYVRGETLTHLDPLRGAIRINTAFVTPEFVTALGASVHMGSLAPLADPDAAEEVLALKHSVWMRHFGGDPEVVGRLADFSDGRRYRIVGVLAPAVEYPVWADGIARLSPERVAAQGLERRGYRLDTRVLARLAPGSTLDDARREMDVLAGRLAAAHPDSNRGWGASILTLEEVLLGDVRSSLWILLGGVGVLLLVACLDVAGLGLARALDRSRELGLRASLGATRGRIRALLLGEAFLIATAGGVLGVGVAQVALSLFLEGGVPGLPRTGSIAVDLGVLGGVLAITAGVGLLVGLLPSLPRTGSISSGARSLRGTTRRMERLRRALVAGQVALTVALLVVAGLLQRSVSSLEGVDGGVGTAGTSLHRVILPATYRGDPDRRREFWDRLLARVRSDPGQERATLVNHVPLSGTGVLTPLVADHLDPGSELRGWLRTAGPDYFETVDLDLVAGRVFEDDDHRTWNGALVVSEALARQVWGDASPLGEPLTVQRQISSDPDFGTPIRGVVVGVVENTRSLRRAVDPLQEVYLPMSVHPWPSAFLVVPGMPARSGAVDGVRQAVVDMDPTVPAAETRAWDSVARVSVARDHLLADLARAFAVVATLLAAVGIYGVLAYSVRRRRRDLALRLALGAEPRRATGVVVRHAAGLVLPGLAIGLAGGWAAGRLLDSVLFQVTPGDPVTLVGTGLMVTLVALVASWIPARRAARVDPAGVLRE